MSEKIILDTDPGIDDAAAITVALNSPDIAVQLISTVAGNVDVEKTTANALKLVQFYQKDVPVAKGAPKPLIREFEDASYVHGPSGMDGYEFPPDYGKPIALNAVEAIHKTLLESPEPLTVVPVGALTNIALLLALYPECTSKIKRIVLMGGAMSLGNTTSAAEFNMYADPHAAQMVFQAEIPIVMIGLDITMKALLLPESMEKLPTLGKAGVMLHSLFSKYKSGSPEDGMPMHDVCTMFYLLHPEAVKTEKMHVDVVLDGPAMGATVCDIRHAYHDTTNAEVGVDIDVALFNQWFLDVIGAIKD